MAGGLFTLLSLSTVMAIASFLAGILPLSFSLSQSQLRLISTIGMGVLVGTSLIVIIPEGVDTLYSITSSNLQRRDLAHNPSLNVRWAPTQPFRVVQISSRNVGDTTNPFDLPGPVIPNSINEPPKTPTKPGVVSALSSDDEKEQDTNKQQHTDHQESPHAWIGIALVSGFLLMYLIDKVPQYTSPSKPKTRTHHIALNNLGRRFNLTTSLDRDEESDAFLPPPSSPTTSSPAPSSRSFATTIGLVIHAAADGIALGASSSTSHSDLSIIIFFAIMVHKAPAAFGLTTILLKEGLSKRSARAHLLVFSLAAPTGAIATWVLARLIGGSGGTTTTAEGTTFWTGMLLLFSGGTFLYVAMHAMQAASEGHHHGGQHSHSINGNVNGFIDGGGGGGGGGDRRQSEEQQQKPSLKDLGAACFGMILPLFLQIGHAH